MVGLPFIPENITVHLGPPDSDADNVTLSFLDYIKNVASSEIYPTWPENALRANIYAQISFALNRIYTEWYPSQGYDFDITNSTAFDQAFVPNRDIYDNISRLVDSLFNSYVRRQGSIEPYFTQYCNGTTVTCEGLSQWGTVPLAEQGLIPYEILQNYYGDDIDIVQNAPVGTPRLIRVSRYASGQVAATCARCKQGLTAFLPTIPPYQRYIRLMVFLQPKPLRLFAHFSAYLT